LDEGAGVLHGHCNLRGKRGLDVGIFFGEGVEAVRLHIQYADELIAADCSR